MVEAIVGVKDLWAPDIIFYNWTRLPVLFRFAPSAPTALRLAWRPTPPSTPRAPLTPGWIRGEVISSQKTDNYNAIDPNLTFDKDGQPWLVFGSFWSGIKMIKVDPSTLKPAANEELISLAAKPGTDAIEGGFITRRGDFYYLFVSHDFCCTGVMSTYNIRVGCSVEI